MNNQILDSEETGVEERKKVFYLPDWIVLLKPRLDITDAFLLAAAILYAYDLYLLWQA